MKKFIAKTESGLCFIIETEGDQTKFFGLVYGEAYGTRKEVTPKVMPNKIIINEITNRPTLGDPMSEKLQAFVAELEEVYRSA